MLTEGRGLTGGPQSASLQASTRALVTQSPETLGLCLRSITGTRDSRGHRNTDTGRYLSLVLHREHSPADREPGPAPHQIKAERHVKACLPPLLPPSCPRAAVSRKPQGMVNSENYTRRRRRVR